MGMFVRVSLLLAGVLLVNFHLAVRHGEFAAPVSLTLEGNSDDARLKVAFIGSEQVIAPSAPGVWKCPPRCIMELILEFPEPPQLSADIVHIKIGNADFDLYFNELETNGHGLYWLPESVHIAEPPLFAPCRNWPGMDVFVKYYLTRSMPGVLTVSLLGLVVIIGSRFRALLIPLEPDARARNDILPCLRVGLLSWNVAGLTFLMGGFIGLEWMQPYYFTQDDALAGELPGILLGCRSLWRGTFPDWNPYVFLGAPLATTGFWAITYPPQLLSYAIARHVLGNEFATMEVFAALHLLVGFIAMRHLARRIGMGPMTANIAALSFVFAGCILIMGRSWHAFLANAVWLPLLGIALQRFREGPVGWKWIAGVGVTLGLSYHTGFPQIVAILGMFFVVGIASISIADRLSIRRLVPVVPAVLLGIGIAAPLLLHHLQMTDGIERFVPAEDGVYDDLHGAVLPYPFAQTGFPTPWGSVHVEKMGHFYFFGGLFALLFGLQVIAFWIFFPDRQAWNRAWWVPCGTVVLLMVLGEPAYLWQGVAALPMSKLFLRYTIRFYPCLAFCAILSGGLILERIMAAFGARSSMKMVVGAGMLGILAYHLAMCQPSFYTYGFGPYPPLPDEFESRFHPYRDTSFIGVDNSRRIASWHPLRSTAPDHYLGLPLNLPHYYQVPSIFGYDPVVEGQPRVMEVKRRLERDPRSACKAYGVGWHLFCASAPPTSNKRAYVMEHALPAERAHRKLGKENLPTLATVGPTSLKELRGVDPLAFATARPEKSLPMHLHCRGADIDVAGLSADTNVTINFLWYPHMQLDLDGEPLRVDQDDWQRITTTLPRAGSTLSLRYAPPWHKTCAVGVGICVAALALAWLTLRLRAG